MRKILLFLTLLPNLVSAQTLKWDDPIVVNSDINLGYTRPKIALTKDNVPLIMWGKANNKGVYASRWDGSGFGTPTKVTPDGVNAFVQTWAGPGLQALGDTAFVSFKAQPEQEGFVYVVRSIDGGKTFGDTLLVSSNNWSRFPEVGILPGGHPVVTFMDFDKDFKDPRYVVSTSSNGGESFGATVNASGIAPGEVCDCCPGFIIAQKERVLILFRNNDDNLRDIWASISTDKGKNFSLAADIDKNNWMIGSCPATGSEAIILGDSLVSVWMSGATGNSKINIGTSDLQSLKVGLNAEITSAKSNQNYPKISGDESFIAITWQEIESGSRNVKCSWSVKGPSGLIGQTAFQVNVNATGVQQSPDISYADGYLHIVWQDITARKIMYRRAKVDVTAVNNVETNSNPWFTLTPNPANGYVRINPARSTDGESDVRIIDALGKVVFNQTFALGEQMNINTSSLTQGVYYVAVIKRGRSAYRKLMVD